MGSVAAVLVVGGIIALIWAIMQRTKASRVAKVPFVKTGEAAAASAELAPGGMISVQGNVSCPESVIAPFSGTPCLYYALKVTAEWKEGDKVKTKELAHDKVAARFAIDDGSGAVWIDASQGGTFEPTRSKRETKGAGLIGGIAGTDLMFGQYRVSTGALSMGTKYTVEEEVLPLQSRLYVNGKPSSGMIVTPGGLRSMILSDKTRDDLLSSALKTSKYATIGGGAGVVVGVVLGVTSNMMAPAKPADAKTAAASATPVATAPPPDPPMTAAAAAPAATPADTVAAAARTDPSKVVLATAKAAVTASGATHAAAPKASSHADAKPVGSAAGKPPAANPK